MTYEEACRQACEDQELQPAIDAVLDAGLPSQVLQTGGFCMVLEIMGESFVCRITNAHLWLGHHNLESYLVDMWPCDVPEEERDEDNAEHRIIMLKDLVEYLREA